MKYTAICALLLSSSMAFGSKSVSGAFAGTVNSLDRASKGLVVDTAQRLRHAFQCTEGLSVYVFDDSKAAAKLSMSSSLQWIHIGPTSKKTPS
jgi:hypothetical protein